MKSNIAIACFAFVATCVCISAGCDIDSPQPINAIIGDASYEAAFGHAPDASSTEYQRISTHLAYVENLLRMHTPAGLTAVQAQNRNKLLGLLHRYRLAGIFPVNTHSKSRTPCFIDEAGRICAVGYLVEMTAGRAAAEAINAHHCYELLMEMKDKMLDDWISGSGLTRLECAMIQPTYNWYPQPVYISHNHISKEYGITSSVAGGVNLAFDALNTVQLSNGSGDKVVPAAGILMGVFQLVLGINNIPDEEVDASGYNITNESQKTLSFVNIGLGTTAILLSTWNLLDHPAPRKTAWRVFGFPGPEPAFGFSLARLF